MASCGRERKGRRYQRTEVNRNQRGRLSKNSEARADWQRGGGGGASSLPMTEAWLSDMKGFNTQRLRHGERTVKLLHPSICLSAEGRNYRSTGDCERDPWHFGAVVSELSWS